MKRWTIHVAPDAESSLRPWALENQELWEVAQFTTLHTTEVADLVSATLTYGDGTVVTVTRDEA